MARGVYSKGIGIEDHALIAAGAGKIPTVSVVNVQGTRENISTTEYQELVRFGTGTYTYPSLAGEAMTIVSDNAADTNITVRVRGLDVELKAQEIFITLNGLTPVALPGTWTRINSAVNVDSTEIQGIVTVNGGGNTYCAIYPDEQQSNMGIYTTPSDKFAQVLTAVGSMVKTGGTETNVSLSIRFRLLEPLGVFRTAFVFGLQRTGDNSIEFFNVLPELTPGPVDLQIRALASTTGVDVSGRLAILEQDYSTL